MFTFRVLKRLLKTRTAIVAASSFFGFLLCEFAVRWLPIGRFDKTTVGIVRANLTRGFEFVPNVSIQRWGVDWNTNSKGFRDYEHQTLKNGFRILGLGDSYFVGHEVSFEDSFLRQLEKSLSVEVVKMAVVNYGTVQERLLWEEEGIHYQPDLVILGVYVGNDLTDKVRSMQACIYNGQFVRCGDPNSLTVKTVPIVSISFVVCQINASAIVCVPTTSRRHSPR